MTPRRPAATASAVALLLAVAGCSGGAPTAGPAAPTSPPATSPAPTVSARPSSPAPEPAAGACRSYALPDPHRPVVTVALDVDGRRVSGSQRVVFTPDLPVTELVFRLWAAAPRPARAGGSATLAQVRVNGQARPFTRAAPTLVRISYTGSAGRPVTIDMTFGITLPAGVNDRFGSRGSTSWLGSGVPLLAWERGRGWATEPATGNFAEAATSEVYRLARLTVRHQPGLSVLATGVLVAQEPTRTVTSAAAVRDLAVAVGAFRTASGVGPGGIPVVVGVAPGLPDRPGRVLAEVLRAAKAHASRFGPFPYPRLAVAVVPDVGGGIEYPGAILLGSDQVRDATISHEVGHEWFYGLVGNNQARDPWLDEAFATYAEALDRGTGASYESTVVPPDGLHKTGRPMTYWENRPSYYRSVYVQGAAGLLQARAAAPAAFDAALRCYVARSAHRIARPADLAAALEGVPGALARLRAIGAL